MSEEKPRALPAPYSDRPAQPTIALHSVPPVPFRHSPPASFPSVRSRPFSSVPSLELQPGQCFTHHLPHTCFLKSGFRIHERPTLNSFCSSCFSPHKTALKPFRLPRPICTTQSFRHRWQINLLSWPSWRPIELLIWIWKTQVQISWSTFVNYIV